MDETIPDSQSYQHLCLRSAEKLTIVIASILVCDKRRKTNDLGHAIGFYVDEGEDLVEGTPSRFMGQCKRMLRHVSEDIKLFLDYPMLRLLSPLEPNQLIIPDVGPLQVRIVKIPRRVRFQVVEAAPQKPAVKRTPTCSSRPNVSSPFQG